MIRQNIKNSQHALKGIEGGGVGDMSPKKLIFFDALH